MKTSSLLAFLLLIVFAVSCGSSSPSNDSSTTPAVGTSPKTTTVTINNYAFDVSAVTVSVGDSVNFVNADSVSHDMALVDGQSLSADTGTIASGASQSITFSKVGTFNLVCTFHPNMTMTVTAK